MFPTYLCRAGPSRTPQPSRPIPPANGSPLPGPIRRSVRALQPPPAQASPATPKAVPPRGKSLWASYTSLSPNTRIVLGIGFAVIGLVGLYADRQILPESEETIRQEREKILNVRTVERERPS